MKILHITPHMGAGAGKAISGLAIADSVNEQRIIVLDQPEKLNHISECEQAGIKLMVRPTNCELQSEAAGADAIVVDWWHHPLTYKVLMKIQDIPSRIVLWSHVNGLFYPFLKPSFISSFDACMLTSEVSYINSEWTKHEQKLIRNQSTVIYGMGNFCPGEFPHKSTYVLQHGKFIIGFVGTLDYAKLHPDFLDWIRTALTVNDNICFEIAGDVTDAFCQKIECDGFSDRVKILGFRDDVKELLINWDAFIYPLNPHNFATTENALLEAMASGLPIVASNGQVEKTIIRDGQDGILVGDKEHFAEAIKNISEDIALRKHLGETARNTVIHAYNSNENVSRFDKVMEEVFKEKKRPHNFEDIIGQVPYEWFMSGCNKNDRRKISYLEDKLDMTNETEIIQCRRSLPDIFRGDAKASVRQYCKYFPEDEKLKNLERVLDFQEGASI